MARFKYYIEMNYLPGNDAAKAIKIASENIRKLFIDHNFVESNMPTMYCMLNVDKSLFDKIVLGAKTDTVVLTVYKSNISTNAETKEIVYTGVCEYFLNHDINYNKDIDYSDYSNAKDKRKDVYTEVNIGLMFKECIERNKQTNNKTVKDSTMMNIVASLFTGQPALIEAFTYNDKFDQLIVPPQETLSKAVAFLNDTKVFYDTQYRLFFEPDCAYLVSSSGKPVAKKDDKYDTVRFIIHNPSDRRAAIVGMQEDSKSKSYVIQINALDTRYNVDANMGKQFNSIEAIINPGKEQSLAALSSMQKVMNDINQIGSGIQTVVKDSLKDLERIPSVMSKMKTGFNKIDLDSDGTSTAAVKAMDELIKQINAMPDEDKTTTTGSDSSATTTTTKGLSKEKKKEYTDTIAADKEIVKKNVKNYKNIHKDYSKSMKTTTGIMGAITGMPGILGGVSPINAQGNIGELKNAMKFIKSDSNDLALQCTNVLMPYSNVMNSAASACTSALKMVEYSGIEADKVKDPVETLKDCKTTFSGYASTTSLNISTQAGFPLQFKNMQVDFEPYVQKMSNVSVNLKAQFTTLKQDMETVGENAKSMLKTIQNAGNDAASILKSNNLSLSSLKDLKNDINAVKDIASIGKLGISKLNFKLDFGKGGSGTGAAIYKIKNDNPNKLKNIKFEMENKLNTFSLNKNDLDISVFNINKKFIIKNFDAHTDKDGTFLLDRKIEIFMREDDKFLCNCQMQFRLIPSNTDDRNDNEKIADEILNKTTRTEGINDLAGEIANSLSKDVLHFMNNNSTLKTLSTIAKAYKVNAEGKKSNANMAKEIIKNGGKLTTVEEKK